MTTRQARARGALLGLATGDALGTSVEFMPPGSFAALSTIRGGGPFRLRAGEWTDDTSMALCLAESLIESQGFNPVDQLTRYVRWWRDGHLSSTGRCFDIGVQTRQALAAFEASGSGTPLAIDPEQAGNGSLMRLAPVPIAYADEPAVAATFSGRSSRTTHPAQRPVDACRYFGAMLAAAVNGVPKTGLLDAGFWQWGELAPEIDEIARGSFARREPPQIKASGFVARTLEAALWALHRTETFRDGALLAVNLGDDADTVGAVYGQIAGAIYGDEAIPPEWLDLLAHRELITTFADDLCGLDVRPAPTDESYWVAPRLLAGKYPGAKDPAEARAKIDALINAGVRTFIDLTVEGELLPYAQILPPGVEHHRIPVTDVTAPTIEQVRHTLDLITASEMGGTVYVHCWGGCGRTGVIVGCYLIEHGDMPLDALNRVQRLTRAVQRKSCPETHGQRRVVEGWTVPPDAR